MNYLLTSSLVLSLSMSSASAQRFTQCRNLLPEASTSNFQLGKEIAADGDEVMAAGRFGGIAFYDLANGGSAPTASFVQGVDGFPTTMGQAIELEGNQAVVSGLASDDRVHLFNRSGGSWTFDPQAIQAPIPKPGDEFGFDVAIGGDWIAVGARRDDTNGASSGAVHLYRRNASTWDFMQTIYATTPQAGAVFGNSVALDGPHLAVGAPNATVGGVPARGTVSFYELNSGTGNWDHVTDVTSTLASGVQFGLEVDLDLQAASPRIAIAESNGIEIWQLDFGFWLWSQRLTGTQFGRSVDLRGDKMVTGPNQCTVYQADAGGMFSVQKQVLPARSSALTSADAVAVANGVVLVGSTNFDLPTGGTGAVHVFNEHDYEYRSVGFGDDLCPCNNNTLAVRQEGCRNSRGFGGHLVGCGSDSAAANDFGVIARGLNSNALSIFFSGTELLPANVAQGDGGRITGGTLRRFAIVQSNLFGEIRLDGLIQQAGWPVGQTVVIQGWYRDAGGPCGSGYNVTNGVELIVQP